MSREEVLARVESDLARGHTHLALQRLGSLVATHPDDLEARARRAKIHRQTGNFSEAGRWGYLTEDVSPQNIAAFEKTFKTPAAQLCALKLQGIRLNGLGPLAQARFALLQAGAGQTAPANWTRDHATGHDHAATTALDVVMWTSLALVGLGLLLLCGLAGALAVYGFTQLPTGQ